MITWKEYPPPAEGRYAEVDGFILNAFADGSWAVWYRPAIRDWDAILDDDPKKHAPSIPPRASSDLVINPSKTLDAAKAAAEQAFHEMIKDHAHA